MWILYLLENSFNLKTYLGITNNLEKRIKQHNGILKGGAKYTHNFKQDGEWILKLFIEFEEKYEAQSMEMKIKKCKKKFKGNTPYEKRLMLINFKIDNEKIDIIYN